MVTNKKPSEMAENTVIEDKEQGWYIKGPDGLWCQMFAHCVDCSMTVADPGVETKVEVEERTSDDFFLDFEVRAVLV